MRRFVLLGAFAAAGAAMAATATIGATALAANENVTGVQTGRLVVQATPGGNQLSLDGAGPFHVTDKSVSEPRLIEFEGSPALAATWQETSASGAITSHYAISRDGRSFGAARSTSNMIRLRFSNFDPLVTTPIIPPGLEADPQLNEIYIVQFVTQPVQKYRDALTAAGATIYKYLNDNAYLVRMNGEAREAVSQLSFVRWVGAVHPVYKLDQAQIDAFQNGNGAAEVLKFSIMTFERGLGSQTVVAELIRGLGGEVLSTNPHGFTMEAMLSLDQVVNVAFMNEVQFMDTRGEMELDMDIAREIGGANYIENIGGYTGTGVRGEVADTGLFVNHGDFQRHPPIIHNNNTQDTGHGSSVYGIVFGTGVGNPAARGMLPDAQGIFADAAPLRGLPNVRHEHTAELVDPNGVYRAVFQTNSTGDARTRDYTTISADMDDILFKNDILICQSQSNANNQDSRPQAWAKNILSVGGVGHQNTLTRADDRRAGGSTGPASDNRIKPDLAHFYDSILTTASGGGYTTGFGGTSGATPIIAGHFGLFFQMWDEGIFGNPVDPNGDVFDNRAHMTTAKAMLINTAYRYPLNQGDLNRYVQGWGMADLKTAFDDRAKFLLIDETDVLSQGDVTVHEVLVEQDTPVFAATMVYADPAGVPMSNKHRINDVTLHVTSPSGAEYWGNNGLVANNFSTTGGGPNDLDTVENVFVADPEAGVWIVEVSADDVNEDGHTESPELDVDYALVVRGVLGAEPEPGACCFNDGSCSDLLPEECVGQGGRWNFNRECSSFQCPIAGACCVNNAECQVLLRRDCERIPGAEFIGEGVECRRACLCDQVKNFNVKCSNGGTIKATLKYRDNRFDGETNVFRVGDRLRFEVTVRGKKATLYTCCFNGPQTVAIEEPEGCVEPKQVNCP